MVYDFEAIRLALGNQPINFLGISYGTQVGAQYAQIFPNNIRTLALDAVDKHSGEEASAVLRESSAYDLSLTRFFEWASTNTASALKGQNVAKLWTKLIAEADKSPIPAPSCDGTANTCYKNVTGEDILFNAQNLLTIPTASNPGADLLGDWGQLAQAIQLALQGNASALSTTFGDQQNYVATVVTCLDGGNDPYVEDQFNAVKLKERLGKAYTPLTRGASGEWQGEAQCIGWPSPIQNPLEKLDVQTEQTVLFTTSTYDPNVPYPETIDMLQEVENVRVIIRNGDGHTSAFFPGDTNAAIKKYLITAEAPPNGIIYNS